METKYGNGNTIAGGSDIDIAINFTFNADMQINSYLMYDFGVDYNNSREYLGIIKLLKELTYVPAPLGIYRFKGKD